MKAVQSADEGKAKTVFLWILLLMVLAAVPVAMVVEGVKHKDSCPAEEYIPLYMIVMGVSLLATIWLKFMHVCFIYVCDMKDNLCTFSVSVIVALWNFGWFIAGSVWVFSLYNMMSTNSTSPFFCEPTIVMFGLYVTSIAWVLLGVIGIYLAFNFFC